MPSELAERAAARIVGARDQRPVHQPHLPVSDQLSDHHLHRRDPRREASESAVVLRLARQLRKEPRKQPADHPQKLAVRANPCYGLSDRQRDQLLVSDLPRRTRARKPKRVSEHVSCDNEGLQRSAHLVLQSRGCRAGGPLLIPRLTSCTTSQPASSL